VAESVYGAVVDPPHDAAEATSNAQKPWRVFGEISCPIVYQYGMTPDDLPIVMGQT